MYSTLAQSAKSTATDINFALGKLYKAIAQNRIPPRNASNLAFVGKLLLLSLRDLKDEYEFEYDYEQWEKMDSEAKPLSNPPSLTPREPQPQIASRSFALTGKRLRARATMVQEAQRNAALLAALRQPNG